MKKNIDIATKERTKWNQISCRAAEMSEKKKNKAQTFRDERLRLCHSREFKSKVVAVVVVLGIVDAAISLLHGTLSAAPFKTRKKKRKRIKG